MFDRAADKYRNQERQSGRQQQRDEADKQRITGGLVQRLKQVAFVHDPDELPV